MSEEVANKLLRTTVAQLLLPVGWHNITNTSVQVLVDVMRRYIESVGKVTSGYAEHGNRCLCNLDDLALAFDEYQIRLPSLQDYLHEVDRLPFPHEVFQFPVRRCNKHVYESSVPPITTNTTVIGENSDYDEEEDETLSPLIPAYLPPLPTKEETEKVDEEDDRESGIHVSDVEEMELGVVEGNTPVDGQIPKGLPGMASSGRRGRTFSTDSDISSEHDDQALSKSSSNDITKEQSTIAVPTRVVPHRINPIRLSEAASPDPIVTPHDDEVSVSGMSLDDSSLESDEEIEVEDKVVPTTSKKRKAKGDVITEDEASLQGSTDVIPEKKGSKKQQKSPSTPSSRIIAKSETKEATSGPYKPTVSSKLLTRFTLAKDSSPQAAAAPEGEDNCQKLPKAGRLPEPPPPLNLKSVPHESKASLSSLSPLSSDISSPRSPMGNKNMQLTLEKFPLESPTKRSYKLDSLSPIVSPTAQHPFPATATSLKDETAPLLSPTITTNSENDDSDVSALSPKVPVFTKKEAKLSGLPKAFTKTSDAASTIGLSDKRLTHKVKTQKTGKEKLVVSINRKYITLRQLDIKPLPGSQKKKSKGVSEGLRSLVISIPKQHYFHAMASRQKPKRPRTLSPAAIKQDRKSKVKGALAEDRVPPIGSREVETIPRPPVVTPADTPSSQPLKLRFKLSSDVVGEPSVTPDVSKDTLAPPPMDWSAGGHSSHKKKRRHKKEKKKKKKKYHDSDSSSDSEGIYSEGNSAKNSPMATGHMTTSHMTTGHILPPLATTVLPYQPAYPLAICPTCKLPDDGRPMIACDICDRWFHWACVNVVTEPLDGMDWYCPECSRDNTGNSSSKRKEHKHKKKKKHSHDHD